MTKENRLISSASPVLRVHRCHGGGSPLGRLRVFVRLIARDNLKVKRVEEALPSRASLSFLCSLPSHPPISFADVLSRFPCPLSRLYGKSASP